jgi:hypothetical protein
VVFSTSDYTITNAEGETLVYRKGKVSGSMMIYSHTLEPDSDIDNIEVRASSSFTVVNDGEGTTDFDIDSSDYGLPSVASTGESSIVVSNSNGIPQVTVNGNNARFSISLFPNNATNHRNITITGRTASGCSVSDTTNGMVIEGATGIVTIKDEYYSTGNKAEATAEYVSLGGRIVLNSFKGTSYSYNGAVKLNPTWYTGIRVLHARKMADPNQILVYWGKMKKAAGYVVYRYDPSEKKYRKISTRTGRSNRVYTDTNVVAGTVYKYKVAALTGNKTKKKVGNKSYAVSAVTLHPKYENVFKIALNKVSLKGKKGGSATLRATLTTEQGKTVLSSGVRWHSMNKKIATVSSKGKVTFKKKGTTYVYAKAHDGMNSRKVKVTVR